LRVTYFCIKRLANVLFESFVAELKSNYGKFCNFKSLKNSLTVYKLTESLILSKFIITQQILCFKNLPLAELNYDSNFKGTLPLTIPQSNFIVQSPSYMPTQLLLQARAVAVVFLVLAVVYALTTPVPLLLLY